MTIDYTCFSKKLSNLAKTNTNNNEAKYSGQNNSFIYKLAIIYNIYAKVNFPSKAKQKIFFFMCKSLILDDLYLNISISFIAINFD